MVLADYADFRRYVQEKIQRNWRNLREMFSIRILQLKNFIHRLFKYFRDFQGQNS
jgi:hypothetical protein